MDPCADNYTGPPKLYFSKFSEKLLNQKKFCSGGEGLGGGTSVVSFLAAPLLFQVPFLGAATNERLVSMKFAKSKFLTFCALARGRDL